MSKLIEITNPDKMTLKQRKWLKGWQEHGNNAKAARDAGYKNDRKNTCEVIGNQNFIKLKPIIKHWLDNVALSDEAIKGMIDKGTRAKETKFFSHLGIVTGQIDVDALGIQQKYVDMAAKVQGTYAAEKQSVELSESVMALISEALIASKQGKNAG